MRKISDILNEAAENKKREFGCVMLQFSPLDRLFFQPFAIKKNDIYDNEEEEYGLEDKPHVTILFGLHEEVDEYEVREKLMSKLQFEDPEDAYISIELLKVSCFECGDYDVIKWDVKSDKLNELNKLLADNFPFTTEHPEYHPHLTIAYVNKGKGKDYKYEPKEPIIIKSNLLKYSMPSGEKRYWKI